MFDRMKKTVIIAFSIGVLLMTISCQPNNPLRKPQREMFRIVSEYLTEKYGFDKSEVRVVEYSPFRGGGGFMGGTGDKLAWMIVEVGDGTSIKVVERMQAGSNGETYYIDDYQLMEESPLASEYLSSVFGVDIGFVEFLGSFSSSKNKRLTKDNVGVYLLEYLSIPNNGIVAYFKTDFANDDLDSLFENAYNIFLDSSLADTEGTIIICAHDVELNIVRGNPGMAPDNLCRLYVSEEYYWPEVFGDKLQEGPVIERFRWRYFDNYRAYAFRLNRSDHVGRLPIPR
jgi:hypothetical protein